MSLAEYKGVYVFAQQVDNVVSSIALELIGKGKDLAKDLDTTVTAVLRVQHRAVHTRSGICNLNLQPGHLLNRCNRNRP